jgi:ABC-type uncharacterized transport system substrate-binding protein
MTASRSVVLAGLALALLGAAAVSTAQVTARTPRIAVFGVTPTNELLAEAFKQGLGDLGYTEGRHVAIEYRDADGRPERLSILLLSSPLVFNRRVELGALAVERRLPTVCMFVDFAEAGGLMAYGPSLREAFRRAGTYAGRVLQGARPAELPVERPTTFEWVINLKTARLLGLTIAPTVRARADRLIEP